MTCKYKDHPFPPCKFEQHPHDRNVYFCPHCRESYDVREVGNQFPQWLLLIIAAIVVMVVSNNSPSSVPTQHNSQTSNRVQVK